VRAAGAAGILRAAGCIIGTVIAGVVHGEINESVVSRRLSYGERVRYGVLGPVEATRDGRRVRLGGPKQRLALALLLLEPGRWRSADLLIDDMWGDEVPERARHTLQAYVSRLRALLDDEIINESNGYRLDVDADSVDAVRFERLVGVGRAHLAAAEPAAAAETLRDALACWRGEPFGDLAFEPALRPAVVRLSGLRVAAVADRVDADLLLGRHTEVVEELDALCREHPFDERLRGLHMRALCGSGRQRDALLVFARTRETFVEELGLEPSAELRQLERLILANDNSLTVTTPTGTTRAGYAVGEAPAAIRGFELRGEVRAQGQVRWVRAYQRVPGREAILRVCDPALANTGEFVATFEPSALAAAAVEHPHLLALDDYWRDPTGAFASWRWLPGGPLSALVGLTRESCDRVPGAERLGEPFDPLELLEQIGGALDSLHRRGIAHGDVCIDSIQLDLDGRAFLSPPWLGAGDRSPTVDADISDLGVVAVAVLGSRHARPAVAELGSIVGRGMPEHRNGRPTTVDELLHLIRRLLGTGGAPPSPPIDAPTEPFEEFRNPYKGLRAFQEPDAADFYGRDQLTDELIDTLRRNRLVAVVGPSGIGKSSVVRAGLLPAVRRGVLGDGRWLVTDMYPGHSPFDELASALLRVAVKRPDDLDAELRVDDHGLVRTAAAVLPAGYSLLLVVDQFEELFSMVSDPARRLAFVGTLVAAVRGEHSRVRIVLTMRADFFDQPLELHELGELIRNGLVTAAFPSDDDLALSVTQPARGAGLELEPGLVTEIVRDVRSQPGGLPLLQHALTELVDRRHGRELTTDAYRQSGGVLGALSRRAEEVYLSLDARRREAAEQLFLRLVDVGEVRDGSRSRVTYSDLTSMGVDVSTIDDVVGRFGAHRLLTFDRDPVTRGPTVEVAHEALFSAWTRLAGWIEARRDDLRLRRRLALAADEWTEVTNDDSFLLRGARLDQFGRWADSTTLRLTSAEHEFLEASRRQEATLRRLRLRRRRVALVVLSVITLVSLVFALVANIERRRADRAATAADAEARHAEAGRLATRSAQQLPEHLDVALLLAVEAHHRDPSAETASALWNALSATVPTEPVRYGVLDGFVFPDLGTLHVLDVNADGSLAASEEPPDEAGGSPRSIPGSGEPSPRWTPTPRSPRS